MKFRDANSIQGATYYMKLADYPRACNRTRIDSLFNGFPPFTAQEVVENHLQSSVNVNDMTAPRAAHAMRKQYANAFLKPTNFFSVKLRRGPKHNRSEWSEIITEEINYRMKKGQSAPAYQECLRNTFAQVTLHGVGPVVWSDQQKWCPRMYSMGDVMIPSMTYRDMSNLSYFAIYKRYTAAELYRLTHGPRVDKAWNVPMADNCIKWAMQQYGQTVTATELPYSPERWEEAIKANTGLYASDQVPTINVWDFYYLHESPNSTGWRRRMVLDVPDIGTAASKETYEDRYKGKNFLNQDKAEFLYDPGDRNYAPNLNQIMHFQFADGSVVAPFLYHSVRSLGYLLYSVCHLQNRIYCKFHDNVFESLLQYFRSEGNGETDLPSKLNLIQQGIIPREFTFITRAERWQVDPNLVQMAINMNRKTVADSAAAYNQDFGLSDNGPEKTATETMAQVNAATSMVGQMLQDAYGYAEYQYQEIARRFCIKDSKDLDVRTFRARCVERGVPPDMLNSDFWDISADRVVGAGNKQLETGMVNELMGLYPMLDPDAQRTALRLKVFSATDDAALTSELVPAEKSTSTTSTHDAELSSTVLMQGIPMQLKQGVSHAEYAATLIGILGFEIQKIMQMGGTSTPDTITGLENLAGQSTDGQPIQGNGAANHVALLAQDETAKQLVKQLNDLLGKQLNELKGIKQRTEEQMAQGDQGQPELDPESAVKLKSQLLLAEAKAQNMRESHAQRSQQKAEIHQQQMSERQQNSELENAKVIRQTQVDESAKDLQTSAEIMRQNAKAQAEPAPDKSA